MIFVLDIGNSNVLAGLYPLPPRGGRRKPAATGRPPLKSWRFATDRSKTADEYEALLAGFFRQAGVSPRQVRGAMAACVVPPLMPVFQEACRGLFRLEMKAVSTALDLGIKVAIDNPAEAGADRLVNAVAGHALYGGPLIVVDFGTATNFDVVSAKGEYLGGAIAPGVGISLEALVTRTAKLPRIEMAKPASAIGRNTLECMRSAMYYGTLGQIKELCARISGEMKGRVKVVATGGLSGWLPAKELGFQAVDPWLTLDGIRMVYERNFLKK